MSAEIIDLSMFGDNPETVSFSKRSVIFVKDDDGGNAYIVRSGAVQVRGAGRAIETVGVGGLFGEMAVIDGRPRSASAVAVADTELIVIASDEFHRLVAEEPGFAARVLRIVVDRLRATDVIAADQDVKRQGLAV